MRTRTGTATPVAVVAAVVVVAFVLRSPFVAVAPISARIGDDLSMTAAQVGLLTSLPVLCFALFTPFASGLIAKAGANFATTLCVVGVLLGTVVRSVGGTPALFAGTIILGAFITIGNVVIPVLIRRDVPPARVGIATGVYTSGLNVGTLAATSVTEPLAAHLGWQLALGLWAVVAAAALVGWMLAVGPRWAWHWGPVKVPVETDALAVLPLEEGAAVPRNRGSGTWNSLTAILLTAAFAGQSFSYYGVTAWLPSILADRLGFDPASAGGGSGVFQIAAVIGALGAPLLAARTNTRVSVVLVGLLWLTVPAGLLVAPELWPLWTVLGGAAQGGGITVVFMVIVEIARSDGHARRLSAFVQGGGYLFGAAAATLVGGVHDLSGDWTVPLFVLLGSTLLFGVASLIGSLRAAARTRQSR